MFKTTKLLLASVLVAGSATAALALPGPYYPGDHMLDYDPINQSYEWQVNHDYSGAGPRAAIPAQPGYYARAQASEPYAQSTPRRVRHRAAVQAPVEPGYATGPAFGPSSYEGPAYGMENPWDKAREDDASEAGHGG